MRCKIHKIPEIPQKRLQTQEETPRKQGDTRCVVAFDACCCPVFLESLLESGVSSGEFGDKGVSSGLLGPRDSLNAKTRETQTT